jgi:hypothetical protein
MAAATEGGVADDRKTPPGAALEALQQGPLHRLAQDEYRQPRNVARAAWGGAGYPQKPLGDGPSVPRAADHARAPARGPGTSRPAGSATGRGGPSRRCTAQRSKRGSVNYAAPCLSNWSCRQFSKGPARDRWFCNTKEGIGMDGPLC